MGGNSIVDFELSGYKVKCLGRVVAERQKIAKNSRLLRKVPITYDAKTELVALPTPPNY